MATKGRPRLKASKIKAADVAEIVEGFWVNTVRFEPGDDPESAPAETNWDYLSRRGFVTLKKEN